MTYQTPFYLQMPRSNKTALITGIKRGVYHGIMSYGGDELGPCQFSPLSLKWNRVIPRAEALTFANEKLIKHGDKIKK